MSHFPHNDIDAALEHEAATGDDGCDVCGRPVRFPGICTRCEDEDTRTFGGDAA